MVPFIIEIIIVTKIKVNIEIELFLNLRTGFAMILEGGEEGPRVQSGGFGCKEWRRVNLFCSTLF